MVSLNTTFRRMATVSALLFAVLLISGGANCSGSGEGDVTTSSSYTYPTNPVVNPVGTIQGVLTDAVTNAPISGAVISIGLVTATTDQRGQYFMSNVSATKVVSGTTGTVINHLYEATIDLRNVNAGITGTNPKYPDFSYDTLTVEAGVEPEINYVISGKALSVGKLAATISGVVAYNSSRAAVGAGWTVKLVSVGSYNSETSAVGGTGNMENIVGSATTDASGAFSFPNIESLQSFVLRAWNSTETYRGSESVSAPADGETKTLVVQHNDVSYDNRCVFVSPVDTLAPEITNVYPEEGADLTPGNVDVVFTFSEPMSPTAYTLGVGPSALGGIYYDISADWISIKAGNIPHTIAWSSNYTVLTISLPGLAASSIFTVDITGASADIVDTNNQMVSNILSRGSVTFSTNGGTAVTAPVVTISNSASLDEGGTTTPILDWAHVSGAKSYNIYRADNELWGATTQAGTYILLNAAPVLTSNYTDGTLATFVENAQTKLTYSYIVKTLNSDYVESAASTVVTADDKIGAILSLAPVPAMVLPISGAAANSYTITLTFNEEMDEADVETLANYIINDLDNDATTIIPVVTAVGSYNTAARTVALTVTLTNPSITGTDTYGGQWRLQLAATSIKDVAGNTMRTTGDAKNNQTGLIE